MATPDHPSSSAPGAWVTLRSLDAARKVPELVDPGVRGMTREEGGRCSQCGGAERDVVLTTGGPLGDAETWRRHRVAMDGRQCEACGNIRFPVALAEDEIQALLDAGAAAGQAGRLDEADLAFRRAANGAPDLGLPRLNLASVCLDRVRQLPEGPDKPAQRDALGRAAAALFRQSLECPQPAPAAAQFLLGRTLVLLGDLDEGQRELRAFLAQPRGPAAMHKEARSLLDQRSFQLTEAQARAYAEGTARIELKRYLDDRMPKTGVEKSQLRQGIARLDALLAERPDHWPSFWITGMASRALRDWDETYRRLGAAYRLHPDQPDVAREYGAACMALGKGEEAVVVTRQAVVNDPGDIGLVANLALALVVANQVDAAEGIADAALRLDPQDQVTQNLLGFVRDVKAGRKARPTSWRPPDR